PDVPEAVEEDEVAGLELALRDGDAHAVLGVARVRERDADLRVDVHREAGAVEAARARAAPDVRRAEVAHGDPDDAAVAGRGRDRSALGRRSADAERVLSRSRRRRARLGRDPGASLRRELRLARALL